MSFRFCLETDMKTEFPYGFRVIPIKTDMETDRSYVFRVLSGDGHVNRRPCEFRALPVKTYMKTDCV
jgi:hypothetical protein